MKDELKTKLTTFGLTEEQIAKLAAEGVESADEMALLTADEIKALTGCGLITAKKIAGAFAPVIVAAPVVASPVVESPAVAVSVSAVDPHAEIPEGKNPSPAEVTGFAGALGMDPGILQMMMFSGMAGNAGMGDMDISGMIPIPQIVSGYNPKVRNMYLMIMGTLEKRMGVPVVVINSDGGVNKELTCEYISGLEEGRDPAEGNIYYADGSPYEVIRVGVDAQSIYPADPLDSSRALQKSGMGTGRVNWADVPLEVKQVVYFAVKTGEIDPRNDAHVTWLRDHITSKSNKLTLRGIAPEAIGKYNEAQRTGSLPNLLVMLSRSPRKP